jgi:hypothetical protein
MPILIERGRKGEDKARAVETGRWVWKRVDVWET